MTSLKNLIKNCLETTAVALLILSVIALLCGGRFLCIETVFQTGAASLVIQSGILLLDRLESVFILIDMALQIGYVLGVLIIFGYIFDWYASLPLGMLIVLGLLVYFVACLFGMYRIKGDVATINSRLSQRNRGE